MGSEALEPMGNPRLGASDDEGALESWEMAALEERVKRLLPPLLSEANVAQKVYFTDDEGAPESWEMVDLEERVKMLLPPLLSEADVANKVCLTEEKSRADDSSAVQSERTNSVNKGLENVDDFLREALQNFRDRVFILKLEQEVEKFMRNPRQLHLEFQPMPSSYLRLAAHRVAQHYYLQSMVVDCNTPEATRIIAHKTPESRFPAVRLADVPVYQPQEETPDDALSARVAIKQRPRKGTSSSGSCNGFDEAAVKLNPTKSVEERKEEYNKARARIFNGAELFGRSTDGETRMLESFPIGESFSIGTLKLEENLITDDEPRNIVDKGDFRNGGGRICNVQVERESTIGVKVNTNRVAIFRDREQDRKDPDYDRSYDRYMQRFDPGFGVCLGPFSMHAMYAPLINYNTEFPQLGGQPTRPQIHNEPPLPPNLGSHNMHSPGAGSNSTSYGFPDPVMRPFNFGHMGPHSGSMTYLHPPRFTCPGPPMAYLHPQERFQQSLTQPFLQPEANFSQARRR